MGRCPTRLPSGGRTFGGQKGGFKIAFVAEIEAEVEALIGPGTVEGIDFEAIETAVRQAALGVACRAVEQRLNADESDHLISALPCGCGAEARYAGRHAKRITTVLGEMTLWRAYYHCADCQHGFFPRDRTLGIVEASLSPAVTRMTGLVGATLSFEEGRELLGDLAGVRVNTKQVERVAEALGAEIAEDERRHVDPLPDSEIPKTLYLGMDGTGVPIRKQELAGRAGKQADGSAKTREVKLCVVWSAEGKDAEGTPVRDEGSVSYSAAIESAAQPDVEDQPSAFAARVEREAARRGFERARRRVVLGDGAPWIWNIADEQFPGAVQVVDRFHAKQRLCDLAKVIYGAGSDLAGEWARKRHDELDAGDTEALLAAVGVHAGECDEARKCLDYLKINRHRMAYPDFHAQGLCTSSGVVEAGCKVAIGTRLKRGGMHWSVRGANAIIALRCAKLSGRFEDFWERRSAPRTATG